MDALKENEVKLGMNQHNKLGANCKLLKIVLLFEPRYIPLRLCLKRLHGRYQQATMILPRRSQVTIEEIETL